MWVLRSSCVCRPGGADRARLRVLGDNPQQGMRTHPRKPSSQSPRRSNGKGAGIARAGVARHRGRRELRAVLHGAGNALLTTSMEQDVAEAGDSGDAAPASTGSKKVDGGIKSVIESGLDTLPSTTNSRAAGMWQKRLPRSSSSSTMPVTRRFHLPGGQGTRRCPDHGNQSSRITRHQVSVNQWK